MSAVDLEKVIEGALPLIEEIEDYVKQWDSVEDRFRRGVLATEFHTAQAVKIQTMIDAAKSAVAALPSDHPDHAFLQGKCEALIGLLNSFNSSLSDLKMSVAADIVSRQGLLGNVVRCFNSLDPLLLQLDNLTEVSVDSPEVARFLLKHTSADFLFTGSLQARKELCSGRGWVDGVRSALVRIRP